MQYRQVYTKELGASSIELGFVNSIGAIIRTILAVPSGILIDKYGLKKLILLGLGMAVFVPLIYALAFDWRLIILAVIWEAVAMRTDSAALFTANHASLNDTDRATGIGLNSSITSISAMVASLVGAFLVVNFGGISVEGIRPLFIIQFLGSIITLIAFYFLRDLKLRGKKRTKGLINDMLSIFKTIPYLKLVVIINVIRMASMDVLNPFKNVYLVELKGGDAIILGSMGAISTAICMLLAIPMGRISDRFGRKKMMYLLSPLLWASLLIIIFTPSQELLLLSSVFDGFSRISMEVIWGTFIFELIPLEARGRWISIISLFTGIGGIIMPIIGGILYDLIPESIFFIRIIIDASILLSLKTLPERWDAKLAN